MGPIDSHLSPQSLQPCRLQLPLFAAALALAFATVAATADPARSPPPACVVSAGARSFDLAELGGDGESVVPALRHVSHAPDSLGWTYSFAACGVVAPLPAACAGAAPGSAALQQTISECFGLGASATRAVAATATGVELSFSGGDGGRSSVITIECADLARPQVVRWGSGAAPGSYTALVRARAGCALECGRDASTGAVCGGATNGACVADGGAEGAVHCSCSEGYSGAACSESAVARASDSSVPYQEATSGAHVVLGIALFALAFCAAVSVRSGATSSPRAFKMTLIAAFSFAAGVMATLILFSPLTAPVSPLTPLMENRCMGQGLSPSPSIRPPPRSDAVTFPGEPADLSLERCVVPQELLARSFTETQHDVFEESGVMTDKAPSVGVLPWPSHVYHVAYDRFLGPFRSRAFSMLEIGLGCDMPKGVGASTYVWRRFLHCANLTVLEFNGDCARRHELLVDAMIVGDQSNIGDLDRTLAARGPFNVIVDDGGHTMKQQITSLRTLFPSMPPGGIYIIEDLHTSFISRFQDHDTTTHQFLADVAGQLHHAWERLPNTFEPLNILPPLSKGADKIARLALGVYCFREICVLERNGVVEKQ
jgi:hypothetical protein